MPGKRHHEHEAPQTVPTRPDDPEFVAWLEARREVDHAQLRSAVPTLRRSNGGDGGGTGGGGGGTGGGVGPAPPLASFHAYSNSRPDVDWNTCGQAAIASMTDFNHKDPWSLPRGSNGFWNDGAAIDHVKQDGFGADVVFGWGTTPGRLRDALRHYGVAADAGSSGLFFAGWPQQWNRLLAYVYYSALPVPVLVDLGLLGGPGFTAHWPIVWKMEYSSADMLLYLANWDTRNWAQMPIPATRFLDAWCCRALPLGFNHAGVYCGTPRISF